MAEKENGISFEESGLEDLQRALAGDPSLRESMAADIVRHSYRAPCFEESCGSVRIDGREYELANIGSRGLGIIVDTGDAFAAGEELQAFTLAIGGQEMPVSGRVVHVSEEVEGGYLCGIELTDLDNAQQRTIRELLTARRGQLFHRR